MGIVDKLQLNKPVLKFYFTVLMSPFIVIGFIVGFIVTGIQKGICGWNKFVNFIFKEKVVENKEGFTTRGLIWHFVWIFAIGIICLYILTVTKHFN